MRLVSSNTTETSFIVILFLLPDLLVSDNNCEKDIPLKSKLLLNNTNLISSVFNESKSYFSPTILTTNHDIGLSKHFYAQPRGIVIFTVGKPR